MAKAGKNPYKEMAGKKSTTYYVKVTNSSGVAVQGHLRVRQLD